MVRNAVGWILKRVEEEQKELMIWKMKNEEINERIAEEVIQITISNKMSFQKHIEKITRET